MPRNRDSLSRAKRLRRDQTDAEAKLWSMLRDRRFREIKFRRQHAIGPYVVDLACVASRLVIEVDGPSHEGEDQIAFDTERTAFLERAGWRVLRIRNAEVYANPGGVRQVLEAVLGITPPG